jgi:hypothetical protein
MPIPTNKTELIQQICDELKRLRVELENIPFDRYHLKNMDAHQKGEKMSLHNLLSYLLGWSQLVITWKLNDDNNQTQHFPCNGYKWNELGKLANKFYADFADIGSEELFKEYESAIQNIVLFLNKESNHKLYECNWYKNYTMGRMVQLNTSSPIKNAILRIRKFKNSEGIRP